jgi:hypothetical protein
MRLEIYYSLATWCCTIELLRTGLPRAVVNMSNDWLVVFD